MSHVSYEIVEHDGGWAYRAGGTFSETFASRAEAREAADRAAKEHQVPGETAGISFQDSNGITHDEVDAGDDRPQTQVTDKI